MVKKSYVRTERGERIDQPDFEQVAETSQRLGLEQLGDAVLVGTDATSRHWVLSGFDYSDDGSNTITITRGTAIVGYRDGGDAHFGLILADGAPTRIIDISSYPGGGAVYGVYVRFEFVEEEFQNRIKWNPLEVTPAETITNLPTRRAENWSIAVEVTSPGAEWMLVRTVTKSATITANADTRSFFFEGKDANTFAVVDADWGGGTDRSTSRAANGVKGLSRFVKATLRQLQDIIGGSPLQWWKNPSGGTSSGVGSRSLTQLNDEKLARNGAQTMAGDLLPNADATRNLGSALFRWFELFSKNITAETITASLGITTLGLTVNNLTVNTLLNIVGSIQSATYNFTTTTAFTQSYQASDLQLLENASTNVSIGFVSKLSSPGLMTVALGLRLPDGVTMGSVIVDGRFKANTGLNSIGVHRVARGAAATVTDLMSSSPQTPADNSPVFGDETLLVNQNLVIDNANYAYFIRFTSTLDAEMSIAAVRVGYETDEIILS